MGLQQLNRLDSICEVRFKNFKRYRDKLSNFYSQKSNSNFLSSFAYGTLVENRLEVYKKLKENNIESRPLICGNIAKHPFWQSKSEDEFLLNANIVHDYGIYLPNHYNLDSSDIDWVCEVFKSVAVPKFLNN